MNEKQLCGIHRVEKRKIGDVTGIMREANRDANEPKDFKCSDIDWSKTPLNHHLIKSDNFLSDIKKTIADAGIEKYRKDAVVMLDTIYTASPEFFKSHTQNEINDFFNLCLQFHEKTYGHTVNAVIHYDETTPHMHVASVPIIKDTNGKNHLSAKTLMGRQNDYIRRQDEFYNDVCRRYRLDRGTPAKQTKAQHKEQLERKIEQLEGKVLTAQEIKDMKVKKKFLSKDEIVEMSYADYANLTKTATAVSNVFAWQTKQNQKLKESQDEVVQKYEFALNMQKNIDNEVKNRAGTETRKFKTKFKRMENYIIKKGLVNEYNAYSNDLDKQKDTYSYER